MMTKRHLKSVDKKMQSQHHDKGKSILQTGIFNKIAIALSGTVAGNV